MDVSTRRFAPLPESAGQARAFTAETLETWGCPEVIDVAKLLVSELVTNAVVHARSDAVLSLVRRPSCVRIEVADSSPRGPQRRPKDDHGSTSGRGIPIVEGFGDKWGVDRNPSGKTVWAELLIA